jgi:hypothetical protein
MQREVEARRQLHLNAWQLSRFSGGLPSNSRCKERLAVVVAMLTFPSTAYTVWHFGNLVIC